MPKFAIHKYDVVTPRGAVAAFTFVNDPTLALVGYVAAPEGSTIWSPQLGSRPPVLRVPKRGNPHDCWALTARQAMSEAQLGKFGLAWEDAKPVGTGGVR